VWLISAREEALMELDQRDVPAMMVLQPGLAPRDILAAHWDVPVCRGDVTSQQQIRKSCTNA
jgi:hypothetical protein